MSDDFLTALLQPKRITHVVDVGANPIDGEPPYKQMLINRLCRVTGFEPQKDALSALQKASSNLETYLPHVLGSGESGTLNICRYSGWTSLLRPSRQALSVFTQFQNNATVEASVPVETTKLDDIRSMGEIDFLKIDVQGGERAVFEGARQSLQNVVAIQTEISFVTLYEQQSAFGEIDSLLRTMGFLPHAFVAVKYWPLHTGVAAQHTKQLLEADLVYVRSFIDDDSCTDEQLKHLALIGHHCFHSYDLVSLSIARLMKRQIIHSDSLLEYEKYLGEVLGIR